MADKINSRDTQFGTEMGWHKKTEVRKVLTVDECFPTFTRKPLYIQNEKGEFVPFLENGQTGAERYAPVASDDGYGTAPIPASYRLFTPQEGWAKVSEILSGTEFKVVSAGTIQNRSRWFISTELTELQKVSAGMPDKTRFILNFFGGLDRSLSPVCNLSAIRIVCYNTLTQNRLDKKSYLFTGRLTQGFDAKLAEATPEIEKAVGMAEVFAVTMKNLADTSATENEARASYAGFLAAKGATFTPSKTRNGNVRELRAVNQVDEMASLFRSGMGNKGQTRADILNGATEFWTHGAKDTTKDIQSQFEASEFGRYADFKSDFLDVLTNEDSFTDTVKRGEKLLASV